jgi:hypothetical protein
MVDIPDWHFHWQQFYRFLPGQEVVLQPGDEIRLECVYDNSEQHQPEVDGEPIAPRDVTWGEGTLDEMCLNYIIVRVPYDREDGSATCPGFDDCYGGCEDSTSVCMMTCGAFAGSECAYCTVSSMFFCARPTCPDESGEYLSCLQSCTETGDTAGCLADNCGQQIADFDACVAPLVAAGECDGQFAECGIDL